jgi:hypothetical protein
MKHMVLAATLMGALAVGTAYAQAPAAKTPAPKPAAKATAERPARAAAANGKEGHTAPKSQPNTAPTPTVPTGELALGSVHLAKSVKADGKVLSAGIYQVKLTAQDATPPAKGQTPPLERWLEFTQKGQVKGREVVTIVPQAEISLVQKDTPPKANGSKVETLKGGDYQRLWINKGGNHYLVHFPTA